MQKKYAWLVVFYFVVACTKRKEQPAFNKPLAVPHIISIDKDFKEQYRKNIPASFFTWFHGDASFILGIHSITHQIAVSKNFGPFDYFQPTGLQLSPGKTKFITIGSQLFLFNDNNNFARRINTDSAWTPGKDSIFIEPYDTSLYYSMYYNSFRVTMQNGTPQKFINYSKWGVKSKNYLDTACFLLGGKSPRKIGSYPPHFYRKYIDANKAVFDIDDSGSVYFTYQMYDSIYQLRMDNTVINCGCLHDNPTRPKFNEGKIMNLAYQRQYNAKVEVNEILKILHNRFVLVIKKLPQPAVTAWPAYKYFVFDKQLNRLFADTIRHPVWREAIAYKGGFAMIDTSMKKAYVYEIPGCR